MEIRLYWPPHLPLPELPDFGEMPSIDAFGLKRSDLSTVLDPERASHFVTSVWAK